MGKLQTDAVGFCVLPTFFSVIHIPIANAHCQKLENDANTLSPPKL